MFYFFVFIVAQVSCTNAFRLMAAALVNWVAIIILIGVLHYVTFSQIDFLWGEFSFEIDVLIVWCYKFLRLDLFGLDRSNFVIAAIWQAPWKHCDLLLALLSLSYRSQICQIRTTEFLNESIGLHLTVSTPGTFLANCSPWVFLVFFFFFYDYFAQNLFVYMLVTPSIESTFCHPFHIRTLALALDHLIKMAGIFYLHSRLACFWFQTFAPQLLLSHLVLSVLFILLHFSSHPYSEEYCFLVFEVVYF